MQDSKMSYKNETNIRLTVGVSQKMLTLIACSNEL